MGWNDCKGKKHRGEERRCPRRIILKHRSASWCKSLSFLPLNLLKIHLLYYWVGQNVLSFFSHKMALVTLSFGEGNGNPLQYSCLENPMDRGAWWAAVHGVTQSRTRLKRLSMHACIGEGNGNPLPCSCLENPRDGGAWWAAVYGAAQSRMWLKWLSSSSSSSP